LNWKKLNADEPSQFREVVGGRAPTEKAINHWAYSGYGRFGRIFSDINYIRVYMVQHIISIIRKHIYNLFKKNPPKPPKLS